MRHRYGAAPRNLLHEKRHNTSARAPNVSKPYRFHPSGRATPSKQNEFRNSLSDAHHTAGIHRLVGETNYHLRRFAFARGASQGKRAESIVANCRKRIPLHDRNVLEGGGMIDRCRTMLFKHFRKQPSVTNIANDGGMRYTTLDGIERQVNFIQLVL